ncbi:23S rRNA (uridine(2552)-2'-O)-methyltransferase RlmE [Buchnera aphidicola]|uniref:23S rRNA (uridine(2552)-2'-O)-methyltransferase RlmE n=1 Tax=Buchnera aphidicola TaxID=9 RepID=UPI003464023C
MTSSKKSPSSMRWLLERANDKYIQVAKKNNIRSRAWFKIQEIDCKNKLFKLGMNIIDLGSSPGSWSQYALSKVRSTGRIIACDILPMKPIKGVEFIQGDFRNQEIFNQLLQCLKSTQFHLVLSDMAPNITGHASIDIPNAMNLCHLALKISNLTLSKKGVFLVKAFQGKGFNELYQEIKILFSKVKICKPNTSRSRSREIFILATR